MAITATVRRLNRIVGTVFRTGNVTAAIKRINVVVAQVTRN